MALTVAQEVSVEMEKRSGGERMRALVMAVGGPLRADENRKSWLARVARLVGISPRAAKAAFYEEINADNKVAWKLRAAASREKQAKLAKFAGVFDAAAKALADENLSSDRDDVAALIRAASWLRTLATEEEMK